MSEEGLRVAITGPTGAIGKAVVSALEANPRVTRMIGMARSPFDPSERGWTKLEYVRGDITDADAVAGLVCDVDVVIHLAFIIFGDPQTTRDVNFEGSRTVFAEAMRAGATRLIYTSSVAAYGFHEDNPDLLDESIPPRGTDAHYYSAQKAEVEAMLEELSAGARTDVYVFRPCIVAGPEATELIENIPYVQLRDKVPESLQGLVGTIPLIRVSHSSSCTRTTSRLQSRPPWSVSRCPARTTSPPTVRSRSAISLTHSGGTRSRSRSSWST